MNFLFNFLPEIFFQVYSCFRSGISIFKTLENTEIPLLLEIKFLFPILISIFISEINLKPEIKIDEKPEIRKKNRK